MADVQEIGPDKYEVPEGYAGNLNEQQHAALVKMWESYFTICDRAQGSAKKGSGKFEGFEASGGKDLKKSGIPEDDAAKDEAKKMAEQQGMNELLQAYGPEALRDSWWSFNKGDNPDANMLRFIRARKWDVDRGLAMMATCLKWRLDADVDSMVEKGDLTNAEEIPKFIDQQKSGKVFSYGFTLKGQPICYVIMKYHSLWGQPAATMQKFIITQMETFRTMMCPPNDKATIFFDLKGFGLKQMDVVNLIYLVKVLESYYPESLGTMYVSNAPLIFWGFWRGVKNFLDPVVRNKIVFIEGPKDTTHDVPGDRIIEYCGGTSKAVFKFQDPVPGENDLTHDEAEKSRRWKRHRALTDEFERLTREWCKGGGKDADLTEKRRLLIKKLRLSSWELDPCFRGRNVYQRNGATPLENPGIANFTYEEKGKTVRQVLGKTTCRKSLERELAEIADGSSIDEAEAKTARMIEDGTWGDWRNNDNSDEIKRKALAALEVGGGQTNGHAVAAGAAAPASEEAPAAVTAPQTPSEAPVTATDAPAPAPAAAAAAPAPTPTRKPVPEPMPEPIKEKPAKRSLMGTIKSKIVA